MFGIYTDSKDLKVYPEMIELLSTIHAYFYHTSAYFFPLNQRLQIIRKATSPSWNRFALTKDIVRSWYWGIFVSQRYSKECNGHFQVYNCAEELFGPQMQIKVIKPLHLRVLSSFPFLYQRQGRVENLGDFNIFVEEQRYVLRFVRDAGPDSGIPYLIVKFPVYAAFFKCAASNLRATWMWFNGHTLKFEIYPEDMSLFLELEAAYFVNTKTLYTPCCFSRGLSALRKDHVLMRYSSDPIHGVVMDELTVASVTARSVTRQMPARSWRPARRAHERQKEGSHTI